MVQTSNRGMTWEENIKFYCLRSNYDKAPKPILFCEDLSGFSSIYLMERVQGTILRASTSQAAMPNPAQFQSSVSLIDTLVELHKLITNQLLEDPEIQRLH